jgi:predicted choloylglycine hydrolase
VSHSTAEAIAILQRVPVSMSYSVTLLDGTGDWATVFVAPDRPTEVTRHRVVTNFQHRVEWPEHARATHSVERCDALQAQIDSPGSLTEATEALLRAPLFQSAYLRGYGTLYGAVYRPRSGQVELLWPNQRWAQSLDNFEEGERRIAYRPAE